VSACVCVCVEKLKQKKMLGIIFAGLCVYRAAGKKIISNIKIQYKPPKKINENTTKTHQQKKDFLGGKQTNKQSGCDI
jgi:hypothetical protein